MTIARVSLEDRFWEKITQVGECWEWTGYVMPATGYGQIGAGGRGAGALYVHRVAWELQCGPIPDGMHVLHHCDNRKCVFINHLFLGTNQDNIDDRVKKGRSHRKTVKLTTEQIEYIRKMRNVKTQMALAEEMNCSYKTIGSIQLGRTHKNV